MPHISNPRAEAGSEPDLVIFLHTDAIDYFHELLDSVILFDSFSRWCFAVIAVMGSFMHRHKPRLDHLVQLTFSRVLTQ